tara:strand:- start:9555 stop:10535 length:981 start_codon:yes stop_codon:yes gene_type:complete
MENKFIIHVGYPKTGSKTLQKHVFTNLDSVHNASWYWPESSMGKSATPKTVVNARSEMIENPNLKEWYEMLVSNSTGEEEIRKKTKEVIESISSKTDKPILLSYEKLTGIYGVSLRQRAARLKSALPHSEIIIVIRSQVDMLRSLYDYLPYDPREGEYPSKRRIITFDSFVDIWLSDNDLRESFNFHNTTQIYKDLFGESVTIIPFEGLFSLDDKPLSAFADVLKIPKETLATLLRNKHENEASSVRLHKVRSIYYALTFGTPVHRILPRRIQELLVTVLNRHSPSLKTRVDDFPGTKRKIEEAYEYCNRKLDEQISVELSTYGYY